MCHNKLSSIQQDYHIRTRQTDVIVEDKIWSAHNLTMLGPKLYGKYIVSMKCEVQHNICGHAKY